MGRMHEVARGVVGVVALTALVGCSGDPPATESVSGLHFTSATLLAGNPPPAVDVTLTDPTPTRAIYASTIALPDFPSGTFNCPVDFGIRYTVVFDVGGAHALTAVLNPGGCGDVTISGSSTRRAIDPAYWASLALNLGVEEPAIYPPPRP
jgi:hypothetical protein